MQKINLKLSLTLADGTTENRMASIAEASYSQLEGQVRRSFSLEECAPIKLQYTDDEGDRVTISTGEELSYGLTLFSKPLRLYVITEQAPSISSTPEKAGDNKSAAVSELMKLLNDQGYEVKEKRCRKLLKWWNGNVELAAEAFRIWQERRAENLSKGCHGPPLGLHHPHWRHGPHGHHSPGLRHLQKDHFFGARGWKGRHHPHCHDAPSYFEEQLKQLESKGFGKRWRNVRLLHRFDGDVDKVEEFLIHRREHKQRLCGAGDHPWPPHFHHRHRRHGHLKEGGFPGPGWKKHFAFDY